MPRLLQNVPESYIVSKFTTLTKPASLIQFKSSNKCGTIVNNCCFKYYQ